MRNTDLPAALNNATQAGTSKVTYKAERLVGHPSFLQPCVQAVAQVFQVPPDLGLRLAPIAAPAKRGLPVLAEAASRQREAPAAKHVRQLREGFRVVTGGEKGEPARQKREENDPCRPHVDCRALLGDLEEHLRGAEPTGARAVHVLFLATVRDQVARRANGGLCQRLCLPRWAPAGGVGAGASKRGRGRDRRAGERFRIDGACHFRLADPLAAVG